MKQNKDIRQKNITNVLQKIVDRKKTIEEHVRSGKSLGTLKEKGFKFVTPV